jgi:hypothetical protein
MQHSERIPWWRVLCLIALFGTGISGNPLYPGAKPTQSASRLTHIVEDVAQGFGYRSMRGTRIPDQWVEGETQGWLVDHSYLTLFGKDSDNSCVGINGRIGVTVLTFKSAEIAELQLTKIKDDHSGNMGFKVLREDREGYLVEEINGLYAAVIAGGDVLLLEDRSRLQMQTIKAIADGVARKTH